MPHADITAIVCFVMLATIGLLCQYCTGFISRRLYIDHHPDWERLGSPGGLLWKPPNRTVVNNLIITQEFWARHLFKFDELKHLNPRLYNIYRAYKMLLIGGAFLVVIGVPLLYLSLGGRI